jgi:cytochrome c oxidase assembly factor CtaG
VLLIGALVVAVHLHGLHRLNRRSTHERARHRRQLMLVSVAGIIVAVLSVCSPLEYWSMQYFWIHMIQHITVMLAAPALYVTGAPALPLAFALPVSLRRRALRFVNLSTRAAWLRALLHVVTSAGFAVISFNAVMILWMLPGPFDFVMKSETLHIGLMLTSFLVTGILFWSKIISSYPFKSIASPLSRAGALLVTNLVMTIVAMSISIFTSTPDYRFPPMMMVMGSVVMPMSMVTMNRLVDQQIGAAILWVCGDFWCLPALIYAIHSALREGSDANLVDRFLRGREPDAPAYSHHESVE